VKIHTIIESMSAYEALRESDPKALRVWWTTSPYLLVNLPKRGETVLTPEKALPQALFDNLGKLSYDLSWEICGRVQEICSWLDFVDLQMTLAQALQRTYMPILYKGLLLSRVKEAAAESRLEVVGDPTVRPADLMPQFGRFDTLYSHLAIRAGLKVSRHSFDHAKLHRLEESVTSRTLGRAETLLSIMTNTPGSFWPKLGVPCTDGDCSQGL